MRLWLMVVGALLLGGCGGSAEDLVPPGNEPAVSASTSRHSPSSAEARRALPNPPPSVPTRLVGGPIVLRVKGATHHPLTRYVRIFRLNRPYPKWPKDPDDPDGSAS